VPDARADEPATSAPSAPSSASQGRRTASAAQRRAGASAASRCMLVSSRGYAWSARVEARRSRA
jgi:hypothetical protein